MGGAVVFSAVGSEAANDVSLATATHATKADAIVEGRKEANKGIKPTKCTEQAPY
jgi:hypothetical protein